MKGRHTGLHLRRVFLLIVMHNSNDTFVREARFMAYLPWSRTNVTVNVIFKILLFNMIFKKNHYLCILYVY